MNCGLYPSGVCMRGVHGSHEPFSLFDSPLSLGGLLAATGLLIWMALSAWGGLTAEEAGFRLREAWDLPTYFYVGLPIMALAVGAAAFFRPERPWRWALWLVVGHQLGVMVVGLGMQSGLSLMILVIVLAVMLAAGLAIPAMIGATVARKLAPRAY